jgi:hypothetical protein
LYVRGLPIAQEISGKRVGEASCHLKGVEDFLELILPEGYPISISRGQSFINT